MSGFARISCSDAKALLDKSDVNVVDIRDVASYNAGHIVDAEHLDNNRVADYIRDTEHDLPLIVCCYHGNTSQGAADFLASQGFDQVFSLDGGYTEWQTSYPQLCEQE